MVGFYSKTEKKTFLGPGESIQYTWDDPTGTRAVHWTLANTPIGFAINAAKVSDLSCCVSGGVCLLDTID